MYLVFLKQVKFLATFEVERRNGYLNPRIESLEGLRVIQEKDIEVKDFI